MWWVSLWLPALLLATTSVTHQQEVSISDYQPLEILHKGIRSDFREQTQAPTTENTETTESSSETVSTTSEESEDLITESTTTSDVTVRTTKFPTTVSTLSTTDSENGGADSSGCESGTGSPIAEELVVETKSGPVQGYIWKDRENIVSYIDIPYGTIVSPFQIATPATSWETVHNVMDHDKRCPQLQNDEYVGNIDCLTLSIFKPINAENASVLFHIHAENFATGSGDPSIYGPEYLVSNGIILALPNYRLGPLGFLCTQNATAPGNMALKDLSLALSWISNNIEAFGGNPDNIAVSGDGRSGALAGLLALSPMSKGYVNKVITESGSLLSYWALDRNPVATATELLNKVTDLMDPGPRQNSELAVKAIVIAAKDIEFAPCLEISENDSFMTENPYETLKNGSLENITFLVGSAMYAGVHEAMLHTEESINKLNENYSLLLPNDLTFTTLTSRSQVGERVKAQYFGNEDIRVEDVKRLSLCFTDIGYLGPGIRSSRLLVEAGATVYFYEFAFVGEFNRVLESIGRPVQGAVRGDIVGYLFTQDGDVPSEEQSSESQMVKRLTEMWTNFLRTGTPSTNSIEWKKLENKGELEEEWLLIDSAPSMKKGLHLDRLPLWTEIYNDHFIDGNQGRDLSPSVYTVLILQLVFWIGLCSNVSHMH